MERYFPKRMIKLERIKVKKRALELFKEDEKSYKEVIDTVMNEFTKEGDALEHKKRVYFTSIIHKIAIEHGVDIIIFKERGKAQTVLGKQEYFRKRRMKRLLEANVESGDIDKKKIEEFKKIM